MFNFPFRVFCRSLIFIWSEYFYLLFDVAEGTLVKESTCGTQAPEGWHPTMVSTHQRVTSGWWSASDHGGYPPAADGRHPTMASIPLRAEGHPTFGPLEIRFAKTLSGLLCHPLVARRICCWRPESGWKDVCPQGTNYFLFTFLQENVVPMSSLAEWTIAFRQM